jgi:hypothetical protein
MLSTASQPTQSRKSGVTEPTTPRDSCATCWPRPCDPSRSHCSRNELTLTLNLTPELADRLDAAAKRHNSTRGQVALGILSWATYRHPYVGKLNPDDPASMDW